MRKEIIALILCLASITLSAQERPTYSLEIEAGAGFGKGPAAVLVPQFVAQYELGGGFKIGAGAGLRLAIPCLDYRIKKDGSLDRTFINELDIPVFLRLGYGWEKLYANVDAGYAIGAIGLTPFGAAHGGFVETCYGGLFLDPQIGFRISPRRALALGVLLQRSTVMYRSFEEGATSTTVSLSEHRLITPAITLRYVISF